MNNSGCIPDQVYIDACKQVAHDILHKGLMAKSKRKNNEDLESYKEALALVFSMIDEHANPAQAIVTAACELGLDGDDIRQITDRDIH